MALKRLSKSNTTHLRRDIHSNRIPILLLTRVCTTIINNESFYYRHDTVYNRSAATFSVWMFPTFDTLYNNHQINNYYYTCLKYMGMYFLTYCKYRLYYVCTILSYAILRILIDGLLCFFILEESSITLFLENVSIFFRFVYTNDENNVLNMIDTTLNKIFRFYTCLNLIFFVVQTVNFF